MGVSNRYHFEWHRSIAAEVAKSPVIADRSVDVACLGERGEAHLITELRHRGVDVASVTAYDIEGAGDEGPYRFGDINDLSNIETASFDVVTLFRASMFITDKDKFLADLARILRPGGVALIDWLHGYSGAPVLCADGGGPTYAGTHMPFRATYIDDVFLSEHKAEFAKLCSHINRPPLPGRIGEIARYLKAPKDSVSPDTYRIRLYDAYAKNDFTVVNEGDMSAHGFSVMGRQARYFYPDIGKFNLYIFTALAAPLGRQ